MPKIEIAKEDFFKLLGRRFDVEKLGKILEYAKSELEEINQDIIKIDIKDTNRPDLWSAEGLARELRGRLNIERGMPKYKIKKSNYKVFVDSKLDRTTVCAIIENVKLNKYALQQIIQIQEKIATSFGRRRKDVAIGVYDKDKIKFPIFFIAEKPENIKFVPLDFEDELTAIEILEKHPKGKEYGNLIKGKEYYPIFVDSNGKIISMPPIINSNDTKIEEDTKNIFIECSGSNIRVMNLALNIITTMLAERGGDVISVNIMKIDFEKERIKCISCGGNNLAFMPWLGVSIFACKDCGFKSTITIREKLFKIKKIATTPNLAPKKIVLDIEYLKDISGLDLKISKIKDLLLKARYEIKKIKKNKIELLYPCYREDIMHQRDVIEDILISYGFDKIEPNEIKIYTIGKENKIERFKEELAEIMVGSGFQEILNYMLTSKRNLFERMNIEEKEVVEIENPISENWSVFRNSLLPSILEFISFNQHAEYPQKIFEIGTCVVLENNEPKDVENLCAAIANTKAGYEDITPYLDVLMRMIKLKYELIKTSHKSFIEGRVAKIVVNKKEIGIVGEIHPLVLENWKIGFPVVAFEINVNALFSLINERATNEIL